MRSVLLLQSNPLLYLTSSLFNTALCLDFQEATILYRKFIHIEGCNDKIKSSNLRQDGIKSMKKKHPNFLAIRNLTLNF